MIRNNSIDVYMPQSVFFAVLMAVVSEAKQDEVAYMTELHTLETKRQW